MSAFWKLCFCFYQQHLLLVTIRGNDTCSFRQASAVAQAEITDCSCQYYQVRVFQRLFTLMFHLHTNPIVEIREISDEDELHMGFNYRSVGCIEMWALLPVWDYPHPVVLLPYHPGSTGYPEN